MKSNLLIGLLLLVSFGTSGQDNFFETKATVDFFINCMHQEWQDVYIRNGHLNDEKDKNMGLSSGLKQDFVNDQKMRKQECPELIKLLQTYKTYQTESNDRDGNTVGFFCPAIPSDFTYRIVFFKNSQTYIYVYLSEINGKIAICYLNGNTYFSIAETCVNGQAFERMIALLKAKKEK